MKVNHSAHNFRLFIFAFVRTCVFKGPVRVRALFLIVFYYNSNPIFFLFCSIMLSSGSSCKRMCAFYVEILYKFLPFCDLYIENHFFLFIADLRCWCMLCVHIFSPLFSLLFWLKVDSVLHLYCFLFNMTYEISLGPWSNCRLSKHTINIILHIAWFASPRILYVFLMNVHCKKSARLHARIHWTVRRSREEKKHKRMNMCLRVLFDYFN